MRHRRRILIITAIVLAGLAVILVTGLALSPWSIGRFLLGTSGSRGSADVVSFTGSSAVSAAHLQWETASEQGILGFNLYRSDEDTGPYELLTGEPVASQGDGGAVYAFVDPEVSEGSTYHYKLEPVDGIGGTEEHGPIAVMIFPTSSLPPSIRHLTFLPLVLVNP